MKVMVIDDTTIQRIVARQSVKKQATVYAPNSPEAILDTPDDADLIFSDRLMPGDWAKARDEYINRNPDVPVIEWSGVEDHFCNQVCDSLPRRDGRIIKTGTARELLEKIREYAASNPESIKKRIANFVAAIIGYCSYR